MKRLKHSFQLQQEQSDCGISCLNSIIRYYGGFETLERLRRLSGTNTTGTTLLGLQQAAKECGFDASGNEADMTALKAHKEPLILHVVIDKKLKHYVICYGLTESKDERKFIIGDPAKGIVYLTEEELNKIWVSKTCLILKPNEYFKTSGVLQETKRKWIILLVKEDLPLLSISCIIGVAIAGLGLVIAIFSQQLVDKILPGREYSKLYFGMSLTLFLLFLREGFLVLRRVFLLRQSRLFNTRVADFFYSHLLRLPKPFFDSRKTGELTARLTDTTRIQRVISQLAGSILIDVLIVLASLGLLFYYSVYLAMGCVLILPVFFFLVRRYNASIIDAQRKIMADYASCEANYISTLQGIEAIKNYNKQALFADSNKNLYQAYQDDSFRLGQIQIKLSFIANAFSILFLVSVLAFTSWQVLEGHLKVGELTAIIGLSTTLLPGVANLALVSIPIAEAKIAFDRMLEFTSIVSEDNEEDLSNKAVTAFTSLSVEKLSFRFPGRRLLLKDISFFVKKGEMIAIIGENGSGKSTITQILLQSYKQEKGIVRINEENNLNDISVKSWRSVIGIVPQNIHVFNGTVLENIAFDDANNKPDQVVEFIHNQGLDSFMKTLPNSFMTLAGEEGVNLSGGQKQMIALLRALYHKPQLLILDEATSFMDRESEKFVFRLLASMKDQLAIIIITHRLHILRSDFERMYVIESGIVSAHGSHSVLMQSDNLYSRYWNDSDF